MYPIKDSMFDEVKDGWSTDYTGTSRHYINGLRHNDNGPAVIWEDGPAIEYSCGACEWYFDGKNIGCFNQEEFEIWLKYKAFL